MNRSTKRILFSAMAAIFLMTACVPAAQPTVDPNEVANQVATSVALTVEAGNQINTSIALTVAAQNTQTAVARPTDTAIPSTVTPVPAIPTATPFVVVPPTATAVSGSGGGSGSTTNPEYACDIIRRRPFDNTFFRPGDEFDIRWTIVNTGTRNLRAGTDVKYSIGSDMVGIRFVELPEMRPGDQYEIILDAVAPATEGHHIMTWVVEGPLCYPYAAIIVEK